MYKLLYNPSVPVETVVDPVWGTTENYLAASNKILQTKQLNFDFYSAFEKDIFANLVRLNWMCNDLKTNRLQKPILCDADLRMFQGGTRMMAVARNPHIKSVAVLCSSKHDKKFDSNWTEVVDLTHLTDILNFDANHIMLQQPNWNEQQLNWIEFALISSADHMHDENIRWRQITNYLTAQSMDFKFSTDWLDSVIDWSKWASFGGH